MGKIIKVSKGYRTDKIKIIKVLSDKALKKLYPAMDWDTRTLTGGDGSTLTGGNRSTLIWKIWKEHYSRIHTFYVGENGIKPNTKYKLNDKKEIEEEGK